MPISVSEPVTVWSGRNGEYIPNGPFLLVDSSGKLLVDISGNDLTDSGIEFQPIPATVWTPNDGK